MKRSAIKKVLAGLSSACMIATAIPFTAAQAAEKAPAYGDANCDGEVNMSDAVMIMQACLNPSKYDVTGTDNDRITVEGKLNGDVDGKDGINLTDALLIQQYSLKLIDKLPIEENVDPVTDNVKIILSGSSITVEGDTNGYTAVEGTTLTISHSGSYYIEGTLDDGQICVNIPDEAADPDTVKLFLNGASITGKSAPAILVSNSENTSVNIVDGTENTLSDGDTAYVDAAGTPTNDAVIEAKDDITIKGGELGTGVLSITANTQKAVSCNNDIKINGGVINIKTLNSTDKTDAVAAKKSVTIKSGTLTIDAEGDG
ncbi:MAG: carbohydrate-binding domain-containing protein, partial [Ruminococcus sp.]|nr:carbohydrate-binding domain-containing protein [Ruminococcus sp.]